MRLTASDSYSRAVVTVPTDNFTVAARVRFSGVQATSNFLWLLSHGTPAAPNGWSVGFATGASGYVTGHEWVAHNKGLAGGTNAFVPERWYTVGWTRNATIWQFYQEGVLVNANAGSTAPSGATGTTYINRTATSATTGLKGDVAWVGQWNYVLTAAQHKAMADGVDPRSIPAAQVLWDLRGPVPLDVSANGLQVTVNSGSPSYGMPDTQLYAPNMVFA